MALWISRPVRHRFGLEESLPPGPRRIRLTEPAELRRLAAQLGRPAPDRPLPPRVTAGELLALSLLEEDAWERSAAAPAVWEAALAGLRERFGRSRVDAALGEFAGAFPESSERAPAAPDDRDARLLRELAALWALERHPAAAPLATLLHEGRPEPSPLFEGLVEGPASRGLAPLVEFLAAAARAPASLAEAVRGSAARAAATRTAGGAERAERLLLAADVLAEEGRSAFVPPRGLPPDAAAAEAPRDWEPPTGPPRYGRDPAWAPELAIVAKQLPVWLHQLGVERLDEVPEEAFERLARWGFTGLWLVGVWERSRASRWIKQLCGNPEATASAYAIAEYAVAADLGGEGALDALRERAARHGIRLVADMVPNHMGLDSPWVLDHPERFLSLPHPPFPTYSFSGPDLSPRPEAVGLYLEDHYYDATDAAVVFERLDRRTGERRYLYHGNDGTGLPWNDTAQLDYRRADVREAVLATIVEVARRFPVIRFDAAMTLTWKHFRRLWFPAPGEGGAIPSRAGHGVSERALRETMPRELWAEVVERVERESPDTLLLAEAFWLMEAHVARDLGVHRVYNSAFVNCLRHDRPAELRRQVADVLRLDRRLLERQVNYLSNPDEAPVREVFGDGPRWRAASVLLATLPGTPLFAHGQVEGLSERYGMEYRRAYRDDPVDEEMVAWHERVLAPLLARRRAFAGSEAFRLLDLVAPSGRVDEAVLAFANGAGSDLHVVVANLTPRLVRGLLRETGEPDDGTPGASTPLGRPCRDLVSGRRLPAAAGGGPTRTLELAPWEALVLADFEPVPLREGAATARSAAPTVADRSKEGEAPAAPARPSARRARGRLVALAAVLTVTTAVGIERWLAGLPSVAGLLLAASAAGWLTLALRARRRR